MIIGVMYLCDRSLSVHLTDKNNVFWLLGATSQSHVSSCFDVRLFYVTETHTHTHTHTTTMLLSSHLLRHRCQTFVIRCHHTFMLT